MMKLKVADMHCEKCVERIDNVLREAGVAHQVNLAEQMVEVEESKVELAIEELDDIGFEAVKM